MSKDIEEIKALVLRATPQHPALSRLRAAVLDNQQQEITSYDRMHHRHSRTGSSPHRPYYKPAEKPPKPDLTPEIENPETEKNDAED